MTAVATLLLAPLRLWSRVRLSLAPLEAALAWELVSPVDGDLYLGRDSRESPGDGRAPFTKLSAAVESGLSQETLAVRAGRTARTGQWSPMWPSEAILPTYHQESNALSICVVSDLRGAIEGILYSDSHARSVNFRSVYFLLAENAKMGQTFSHEVGTRKPCSSLNPCQP